MTFIYDLESFCIKLIIVTYSLLISIDIVSLIFYFSFLERFSLKNKKESCLLGSHQKGVKGTLY